MLQQIGYSSLLGGYKQLFRLPLTKKYRPGTTFDEIVALYQFDAELREPVHIWAAGFICRSNHL
jgi:abortive infection bacteriophage resistance protein